MRVSIEDVDLLILSKDVDKITSKLRKNGFEISKNAVENSVFLIAKKEGFEFHLLVAEDEYLADLIDEALILSCCNRSYRFSPLWGIIYNKFLLGRDKDIDDAIRLVKSLSEPQFKAIKKTLIEKGLDQDIIREIECFYQNM